MREGLFIRKNKDRWEQLEHESSETPDETARNFTRLVDDLAYAKTFYPTSKVTRYVNGLAAKIYLKIYRNRKEESNRLISFWKYDLPRAVGQRHLAILLAFIVFAVFFSVGFFSSANDSLFVRDILGDAYVDMTEQNIREGNPFAVYASENSFVMWIGIMVNNIGVSFYYFFRGIFFGIPSLLSLGQEGIRLGAFEQMFFAKDLGAQSIVTVLIHGMLELTAIIIACAAGAVMGTGWLFPGTDTRFKAFQKSVKDGAKMVIGLIPVFIIAAFFEGYVTRHYKMQMYMSLSILAVCAVFIVWYFILYPIRLLKKERMQVKPEQDA